MSTLSLLFDIGGTKMRLAISRDGKTFDEPLKKTTPRNFEDGMALFAQMARTLAKGEKITVVAGGIAGPLNSEKSMLTNSPNISGWTQMPLKQEIEKIARAPVFIENDTAMVGMGEAHAGAGQNFPIMVYITVSTGVGGVRIVDGAIDRNAMGFEPGHQIIDLNGAPCSSCKSVNHIEGNISGAALELRFGKKAYELTDSALWEEEARLLAIGLNNSIVHWSPDGVVLGGSMVVKRPGIDIERVRFHLKKIMTIFPEPPPVVEATLKDDGGLHGAFAYLRMLKV